MSCGFTGLDGSYVLGALDPGEAREFEAHLPGCAACTAAVRELAGMPALLALVDADVLERPPPPLPETLLPALVAAARSSQRRRTAIVALLGAAAAAVVAVVLVVAGAVGDRGTPEAVPTGEPSAAVTRTMTPVGYEPLHASVGLTPVAWGTRLDLECTYESLPDPDTRPGSYVLVVRTRDGHVEQVATWQALPGRTMHLTGATAATPDQIVSVEMRTRSGAPVLRLVL